MPGNAWAAWGASAASLTSENELRKEEQSLSHERNCPGLFSRKCICEGRGACGSSKAGDAQGRLEILKIIKNNATHVRACPNENCLKTIAFCIFSASSILRRRKK